MRFCAGRSEQFGACPDVPAPPANARCAPLTALPMPEGSAPAPPRASVPAPWRRLRRRRPARTVCPCRPLCGARALAGSTDRGRIPAWLPPALLPPEIQHRRLAMIRRRCPRLDKVQLCRSRELTKRRSPLRRSPRPAFSSSSARSTPQRACKRVRASSSCASRVEIRSTACSNEVGGCVICDWERFVRAKIVLFGRLVVLQERTSARRSI